MALAHPDTMNSSVEVVPIPTLSSMFVLFITYLSVLFGMREVMKSRVPSSKVAMAFRIYDLSVSMASMSIAVLLGMEGWSIWNRLGVYGAICSEEAFTPVSACNRSCLLSHP